MFVGVDTLPMLKSYPLRQEAPSVVICSSLAMLIELPTPVWSIHMHAGSPRGCRQGAVVCLSKQLFALPAPAHRCILEHEHEHLRHLLHGSASYDSAFTARTRGGLLGGAEREVEFCWEAISVAVTARPP